MQAIRDYDAAWDCKLARNEADQENDEDTIPHGTKVLKELVMPWSNTDRIVSVDSYFASVPVAE